jgi:UDP-N-acetylglucosamine/UDP-N-acetylgalactosamine diphosphorylase
MSNLLHKLLLLGQAATALFSHWKALTEIQQQNLSSQVAAIDVPTFQLQQECLQNNQKLEKEFFPPQKYAFSGSEEDYKAGIKAIGAGKVACLILAGGQGTRLGWSGPKGTFPISLIKQKSLFQLICEKTKAAGKCVQKDLSLAFMTSPDNHSDTLQFFQDNDFFGLAKEQISFFSQEMLPLLDTQGNLFLEEVDSLAFGPDGNGFALHLLVKTGLLRKWQDQGVEIINVILIDNPLADPFDAELIGFHIRQQVDLTLKSILRIDPHESVGVVVQNDNNLAVVEYSEILLEEREAVLADGSLKYPLANLSLFCINLSKIQSLVHQHPIMPLHRAFKSVKGWNEIEGSEKKMAWKFEKFIFDILPWISKEALLVYPREACFSPLKNSEGAFSSKTVQADLQSLDRQIIRSLTGLEPPNVPFELSQEFYYLTPAIREKWKGRSLPNLGGYIEV